MNNATNTARTYIETAARNDAARAAARAAYTPADWAALQAAYDREHASVLAERISWGYSERDAGDVARAAAYRARSAERKRRGLPPVA